MTNSTDPAVISTDTELVSVTMPDTFQGVTLWLGDGAPCNVDDRHRPAEVRDWITAPLQRRAMAARLRLIAEWLDDPMGDLLDGTKSAEA